MTQTQAQIKEAIERLDVATQLGRGLMSEDMRSDIRALISALEALEPRPIDWRPKSEPITDKMIKRGETFLVGDERDPHWFAFISPCDDGDLIMTDKDGVETSKFTDYSNDIDQGEMPYTHWARLSALPQPEVKR